MSILMNLTGRKIGALLVVTLALGAGGGIVIRRSLASSDGDCCAPGAPCCHPGSPCCHGHNHVAQR